MAALRDIQLKGMKMTLTVGNRLQRRLPDPRIRRRTGRRRCRLIFGTGTEAVLLGDAPGTGIGFIEAHGLALIIGLTLWPVAYSRHWHAFLAAVHLLLGTANLLFWQFFIAVDVLIVGYATTAARWLFVVAYPAALAGAARLAAPSH